MKLILIRHGLTDALEQHLYYGAADVSVNEKGMEALKALREEIDYPLGERYYTSGMLRAEQTFEIIYGKREHGVIPQLREMNFGIFEMKSYEMLKDQPLYQEWITGDYIRNVAPEGESFEIMGKRCAAAAEKLAAESVDTVAVCHGGAISAIMSHYFGGDNPYAHIPDPGRGFVIEIDDDSHKALSFYQV